MIDNQNMSNNQYFRRVFIFFLFAIFAFPASAQSAKQKFNRTRTYDVQHYTIRVSFDRARETVYGDTTVHLKPLQNGFNQIELDAAGMKFDVVEIEAGNKPLAFKTADDKIFVTLDKSYSRNNLISVRFKYSTTPRTGIYFIDADVKDGRVVRPAQIWTHGEPEGARFWFPSYDFPDDKATSEQYITAPPGEIAVGNGEQLATVENADGTKTFHFKMAVPHSTYLTSFVVGDYVKVSDSYKNVPLGFYMYPGGEASARTAYGSTKNMMRVFEELTGIAFPFNKYDQTLVAKFNFGGLENITATTLWDTEVLLNPPNAVEDLVSHELAHSWFGNMVTCRNWAELWLNEGFATFMEAAYREKVYGRADYLRKLREDAAVFVTDDAVNRKRHGLFNPDARPDDTVFNATNYQKGGLVIHTLRETVGEENFWKAVNVYLTRHKFQNVETKNLQAAMEDVSKINLDWFFRQWVYGGGYPKIRVEQNYDAENKRLELYVKQIQEKEKITPEAFVLQLDVEITTARGVKFEKLQIKDREQSFSIKLDAEPTKIVFDKDLKIPLKSLKIQS